MSPRPENLRTVHPCPRADHADLGVHMHEVEPGKWRLYETPKEKK